MVSDRTNMLLVSGLYEAMTVLTRLAARLAVAKTTVT
jgi:hypothetical protein